jgi:Predicted ATPase (PP-loop superfamily)
VSKAFDVREEPEPERITIAWSGGFDSTALILYYMGKDYVVDVASVKLTPNTEAQVMRGLVEKFEKKFGPIEGG